MIYKTIQGQTWDQIAREVYGSELKADVLMAANQKQLDVFIFPAGVLLDVPELEERNPNLPPWRT